MSTPAPHDATTPHAIAATTKELAAREERERARVREERERLHAESVADEKRMAEEYAKAELAVQASSTETMQQFKEHELRPLLAQEAAKTAAECDALKRAATPRIDAAVAHLEAAFLALPSSHA